MCVARQHVAHHHRNSRRSITIFAVLSTFPSQIANNANLPENYTTCLASILRRRSLDSCSKEWMHLLAVAHSKTKKMTRQFVLPRPTCLLFAMACLQATVIISANAAASNPPPASSAEDYLIRNLHEAQPSFASFDGEMYSGLLSVRDEAERSSKQQGDDGEHGKLFFWLLEPHSPTNPDSLVLWLNGGPGCSSLVGMLFENGPVVLPSVPAGTPPPPDPDSSTRAPLLPNPYSWTNATRMLYVEQPVGVGFSTAGSSTTPPRDEGDVSEDMYHFLLNFYDVFPHLTGKEFYIFGESYAGMYVPSIAHHIHEKNSLAAAASVPGRRRVESESQSRRRRTKINLAGVGIGNGWIDATIQGRSMIDYAYWHGLIDSRTRESLHATWEVCRGSIGGAKTNGGGGWAELQPPFHPFTTPDECGIMGSILAAAGAGAGEGRGAVENGTATLAGPSTYDVTTWDEYPALFDANGTISRFLDDDRVRDMLHVPRVGVGADDKGGDGAWSVCLPGERRRRRRHRRNRALQLLDHDAPISMTPYISSLLEEANIRVLVYNGDRDLSCCVQGTEKVLNGMEWSGRSSWLDPSVARRGLWMVPGEAGGASGREVGPAGYVKSHMNLTFLVVYNSGHLVPLNQPRHALDLIDRFLGNRTYSDVDLPFFYGGGGVGDTGSNDATVTPKQRPHYLRTLVMGFVIGFGVSFAFTKFRDSPRYQRIDSGWL